MSDACLALAYLSELDEDGEVISVGDQVSRWAVPRLPSHAGYFGDDRVDATPWEFDRYAEGGADGAAIVEGTVTAIEALYVRVTRAERAGWVPRAGTVTGVPLSSTAQTRRPVEAVRWSAVSAPDPEGFGYAIGFADTREGDEMLTGWLFTLRGVVVRPTDTGSRTPRCPNSPKGSSLL